MLDSERLHAIVEGRVQGVGFRYFVQDNAVALSLTGWVRNLWNGSVEITAEGDRQNLEIFLRTINRGPGGSIVKRINHQWLSASHEFQDFRIRATST